MRCPSAPPAHAQQTISTPPTRQSPTSASQYAHDVTISLILSSNTPLCYCFWISSF
ncbi:hypothetical protein I315_05643 [Cryptococcus gattii Ru294]|nr:hypothetical protein I315_05643 [Cryptococcus gattii Ru294]